MVFHKNNVIIVFKLVTVICFGIYNKNSAEQPV